MRPPFPTVSSGPITCTALAYKNNSSLFVIDDLLDRIRSLYATEEGKPNNNLDDPFFRSFVDPLAHCELTIDRPIVNREEHQSRLHDIRVSQGTHFLLCRNSFALQTFNQWVGITNAESRAMIEQVFFPNRLIKTEQLTTQRRQFLGLSDLQVDMSDAHFQAAVFAGIYNDWLVMLGKTPSIK